MKRAVLWLLTIALSVLVTLAVFFPATWLGSIVEQRTGGRSVSYTHLTLPTILLV